MKISQHANERMLQMGVTRGEVDSVRAYPERTAEFAALRTHAPMQWLTLCCWAGGMTVRQTGVSLLIRDNTVVKHRMALRRKKLTPWTYDQPARRTILAPESTMTRDLLRHPTGPHATNRHIDPKDSIRGTETYTPLA